MTAITQENNMTYTLPFTSQAPAQLQWRVPHDLDIIAAGFDPISLKQMDSVALLNRVDTKFVLTCDQLQSILTEIQPDYYMLSINGQRLNHYRTLYFDTPDFALYNAHINKRAERYKVRSREYADSHMSFLEVKHKTRKDRTIKDRISTNQPATQLTADMNRWLQSVSPLDGNALQPKLWNSFTRITLVSKRCCERVTLDVDLTFYTEEKLANLNGLAIAEVKTSIANSGSLFQAQMRSRRIHERGFSKYSTGVAILYDNVKKNPLKPQMLWLEKILKGDSQNEHHC